MMREKNQVEGDRKLRQSVRIDRQKVFRLFVTRPVSLCYSLPVVFRLIYYV